MQTGSTGVWKVIQRLELPVERHHFIAVPRINRIAHSKFDVVEISNRKNFRSFIFILEASYEIYENLNHSKFSRYTVHQIYVCRYKIFA